MVQNVQCPVCTLYLHAGMSLSDHLETHPKEQVIKALVEFTISKSDGDNSPNSGLSLAIKEENEKKANNNNNNKSNVEEAPGESAHFSTNFGNSKKLSQTNLSDIDIPATSSSYQTDTIYNRNFTQQQQQQQQESQTFSHEQGQLQEKQQQHITNDEYAQRQTASGTTTVTIPAPPPPPPPRSPTSAMQHAYASLQSNHQHTILTHHQLQQQQQQQNAIKVLPWNMLPMQPPLQQLISYQAAAHATPHQKPPPAYVTAISQIRSQHNNQTKQPMQQQPEQDLQGYHRNQRCPNGINLKQQQQPQNIFTQTTTDGISHCQEQMLPQYANVHEQQQQYNDAFNNKVPSQINSITSQFMSATISGTTTNSSSNSGVETTTTNHKHFAPPARPLSRPQSAYTPTPRQSNSPYPLAASSPAPSVLRYAESPVAHYLERDNGDFIVQETPKHIVECVETDDGDFAVTERIYQSPPSVLQMHFDDEDEEAQREDKFDDIKKESEEEQEEIKTTKTTTTTNEVNNEKEVNKNELFEDPEFLDVLEPADKEFENTTTKQQTKNNKMKKYHQNNKNVVEDATTISCDAANNLSPSSKSKRSAKNSITVLSDVQLNLNEYLDLMGNIIASSKMVNGNKTFCNNMQLRRIKVEKEEYYDDEYEQQQEQMDHDTNSLNGQETKLTTTTTTTDDDDEMNNHESTKSVPPKKIRNNKISNNTKNIKVSNKTDEINSENLSQFNCNELAETTTVTPTTTTTKNELDTDDQHDHDHDQDDDHEYDNDIKQAQVMEESKENYAETSVIRMATTSQKQQQQPICEATTNMEKCVAEDLSQQNKGIDIKHDLDEQINPPTTTTSAAAATTTVTTAAANLHKKGPKKLIIKPKSAKTEQKNITTTTTTKSTINKTHTTTTIATIEINKNKDDEKPTTSAAAVAAAAQMINLQQQIDSALKLDLEPIVKHETATDLSDDPHEEKVEQQNIVMDCEPEDIKYVAQTVNLKLETERNGAITEDARMLYEFAHSKKHKAAAAAAAAQQNVTTETGFLSSLSIFSKVSSNDGSRPGTRSPSNNSLRCDDEFIPVDVNDTLNYSTNEQNNNNNNVEQQQTERANNFMQQQQQHHTFADYPFSFLYGANTHGQAHGSEEMPRFGNFSPSLYQQHAATDGGGTTAATLASGSNSLAASMDDSCSTHHLQQQHQQQQQQQQQQNFDSNHWYQQQTVANADFETALAVVCTANNAVLNLPDEGNKYLDLDGFCKRESSSSYATTSLPIVVASSATSSSFAGATDSSLAGGDALNIRTDEKMPAKGEISEQESNCDIENSWSQPVSVKSYLFFNGLFFYNSFICRSFF